MERDHEEGSVRYETGHGERAPPTRWPLNSKRFNAGYLRRLAEAMELPMTASADELRQMIDGQLAETEREAQDIQVALDSADPGAAFSLEDEGEIFLTVAAVEDPVEPESEEYPELEAETGGEDLCHKVESLTTKNQALKSEVSSLEKRLCEAKARFREMWRNNCECLAEYDEIIAQKYVKIA